MWIADLDLGLLRYNNGSVQVYTPNGPHTDQVFSIRNHSKVTVVMAGGYDHFGFGKNNKDGYYVVVGRR